jgi:hypothetical protein
MTAIIFKTFSYSQEANHKIPKHKPLEMNNKAVKTERIRIKLGHYLNS